VTFADGAFINTVGLRKGVATFMTKTLPAGPLTLTANYTGSTKIEVSLADYPLQSTNVLLTTQPTGSVTANSGAVLSAEVAPAAVNYVPTGSIRFLDGATTLGTATIGGQNASLDVTFTDVGPHSLTAQYLGDTHDAGSVSAPISMDVTAPPPGLTITSATNPAQFGVSVNFTATLTGATNPTGDVTFSADGTPFGTVPLSGNSALLSLTGAAPGLHHITATYLGDANNAPATTEPVSEWIYGLTTTTLTSNVNPVNVGAPVTFIATVEPDAGRPPVAPGTPTGSVTFYEVNYNTQNFEPIGVSTLVNGVAKFETGLAIQQQFVTNENEVIRATYEGDATFQTSSSSLLAQAVLPAVDTNIMLFAHANPAHLGDAVTLIASIGAHIAPTGDVVFTDAVYGDLGVATVTNGGSVSISVSTLALGDHTLYARYLGDPNNAPVTSAPVVETITNPPVSISSGYDTSCSVLSDGTAKCWGQNQRGGLGIGPLGGYQPTPQFVQGLTGAAGVSSGLTNSCAVLTNGGVKCWGTNHGGELGNGTYTDSLVPTDVVGLPGPATAVGVNGAGACALVAGTVLCWGYNEFGELGNGSTGPSSNVPVQVSGLAGVTAISVGYGGRCAVLSNGTVKCWGDGAARTPVLVSGLSGVTAISVGPNGSCAVATGGSVKCWGAGFGGAVPGTVALPSPASSVSVGGDSSGAGYACATLANGAAPECWGANYYGTLGTGSANINITGPVPVAGLANTVTSISAGWFHACALEVTGVVQCWGDMTGGEDGLGPQRPDYPATYTVNM
jgi:hypothetical protein